MYLLQVFAMLTAAEAIGVYYYLPKYLVKSQNTLARSWSALTAAVKKTERYGTSVTADEDQVNGVSDMERTTRLVGARLCNHVAGCAEIPQTVMTQRLTNQLDIYCTDRFARVFVHDTVRRMVEDALLRSPASSVEPMAATRSPTPNQQTFASSSAHITDYDDVNEDGVGADDSDDIEMDDDTSASLSDTEDRDGTLQSWSTSGRSQPERVSACTAIRSGMTLSTPVGPMCVSDKEVFENRGDKLRHMTLNEFKCTVALKKRRPIHLVGNHSGAGRKCNGTYAFDRSFRLHRHYIMRLVSKTNVPLHVGGRVLPPRNSHRTRSLHLLGNVP